MLRKYSSVIFVMKKSRSKSPQCRAFSRTVKSGKLLLQLSPEGVCVVGGGGVRGQWLQVTGAL